MFNSVSDAKKIISVLQNSLIREDECTDTEVYSLIDALNQIFEIIVAVNKRDEVLTAGEITATGEQGLLLTDHLIDKLIMLNISQHKHAIEQVALVIANWVIKHNGQLVNIQSVVDGLAYIANAIDDKVSLLQLSVFLNQVAHACQDDIQYDLDNADPSRPWRTLNMNRGIVATRTHDPEIMQTVFVELIKAIPLDAPVFFKEGLSEMLRQNYPEPVRELIQLFYDKTQSPVLH
ncbi:MAG: hypothetical protein OEY29_13965 [Gammaproteobacteria bacterium]|nr:hypothetical protein [Gammaproteobacteria bacterium]